MTLATYAKPSEVRLRATAKADSAAAAEAMLAPVVKEVTDYLGDVVYGVDIPNLETVCMTHLKEKGWTFATAESCTGGQIAARITALSGASSVYRGGVVSYWTSVKAEVLGVPQTLRYFEQMQERIVSFVAGHSGISARRFTQLMHNTGELVMDMGTVLGGEQAVEEGLIDAIGNLGDALRYLYAEIDAGKTGY